MQFLVFSDSHGSTAEMSEAIRRNPTVKTVLFLGDGLSDIKTLAKAHPDVTFRAVRGNCDPLTADHPTEDFFSLYGVGVFLAHGHTLGVKTVLGPAISRAREAGASVLLFGHTHLPFSQYLSEYGIYVFNPGSIGKGLHPTYGVIRVENGRIDSRILPLE